GGDHRWPGGIRRGALPPDPRPLAGLVGPRLGPLRRPAAGDCQLPRHRRPPLAVLAPGRHRLGGTRNPVGRAGVLARPALAPPLPESGRLPRGTGLAGGQPARPVPAGGDPDGGTDRRRDDLDRLGLLAPRQPDRLQRRPVRGDLVRALGPAPPRLPVPATPARLAAGGLRA